MRFSVFALLLLLGTIYTLATAVVINTMVPNTVTQQAYVSTCNSFHTQALSQACQIYQSMPKSSKYMIIFDMTKPNTEKRLFLIDMSKGVISGSYYVAHGINSGTGRYVEEVSNVNGSLKSSQGLMITAGVYKGKHGASIKLRGLERGINDQVYNRAIVIHGSDYADRGGHSWGCLAVPYKDMQIFLNLTSNGVLVYAYFR